MCIRDRDSSEVFTFVPTDSTMDSIYIYNDYVNENSEYKFDEFTNLASTYGDEVFIDSKNWGGDSPRENLVMGFDFETALDNRNLLFQFAWNYSLTNNNIWDGPLSLAELDVKLDSLEDGMIMGQTSLEGVPDPEQYKDLFTINEFMTPFAPIDLVTAEGNLVRAIINMPSAAFHMRVKGSYSLNNLLLSLIHI